MVLVIIMAIVKIMVMVMVIGDGDGDGRAEDYGGGEDDDDNDVVSAKVHLDDKLAVTTDSMKIGGNRNDDRQAGKHIG